MKLDYHNLNILLGKPRTRDESMAEMLLMNADGVVDDALLDSLVKTATQSSSARSNPRERKRSRHADRKSCKFPATFGQLSFNTSLTFLFIGDYISSDASFISVIG